VLTKHFEPARLGAEITPALFFGYPTLGMLAQYFMEAHGEAMGAFYREGDSALSPQRAEVGRGDQRSQSMPPSSHALGFPPPRPGATASAQGRQALPPAGGRETYTTTGLETSQAKKPPFITRERVGGEGQDEEPIAIIGMSGRFPQERNIAEMWSILTEGREGVTEIPADRFDWRPYYGDPAAGKTDGKWSGCVPGVREFDPLFFDLSPREAETMDPRQRLLLQEAWNALEDAGYGRKQIEAHRIGMFVG